ncbi:porin family protein [Parahaliea maris]|uniref:hypothetical protein n=1 Tax=Parahaliea maris TaxID=2716870 RepID=UPI0016509CAD|nr:hypothetical protein [Parahaliea maris]
MSARQGLPALILRSLAVVAGCGVAGSTLAAGKIEIGDESWVSVGAGIRTAFIAVEDGAPNGDDNSTDFDVQNIRLYFNGQVNEWLGVTVNTDEIFGDGPVDVLDAMVRFEMSPYFNVWVGRMLTPADRIEMNGPFYSLTWNQYTQPLYPSDQGGDAGTYGRDDGVTVWGKAGKFQYAVGAFDGLEGLGNTSDSLLYAARFAYNFLNMEDNPGYYTSSTYYGGLGNILTLGLSLQSQSDGTGSATQSGDFSGYTVDLLSETVFGDKGSAGVLTIEAEYKDFDADYTIASPAQGDCFCLFDGDSWFASAAFLFPAEVGPGKFQPYVRFVENSPSDSDSSDLTELGVNYVISGHNARLNFNYATGDANISGYAGSDVDSLSFGVQVQI